MSSLERTTGEANISPDEKRHESRDDVISDSSSSSSTDTENNDSPNRIREGIKESLLSTSGCWISSGSLSCFVLSWSLCRLWLRSKYILGLYFIKYRNCSLTYMLSLSVTCIFILALVAQSPYYLEQLVLHVYLSNFNLVLATCFLSCSE